MTLALSPSAEWAAKAGPMHASLMTQMRGADGRSLARALVVLFIINLFMAGAAASGAVAGVVCSVGGAAATTQGPAPTSDTSCCLFGCAGGCCSAPVEPNPPFVAGHSLPAQYTTYAPIFVGIPAPQRVWQAHAPRGPPLSA